MTETVLQTHSLCKSYGSVRAVSNLDLSLERGEMLGFLGPNGAGKTTSIRVLLGLLRATSGRAEILGLDSWRDSVAVRRHVGYLPGDVRLWDSLRGAQVVERLARFRAAGGCGALPVIRQHSLVLAEQLELDLSKRVRQYSKGNRQKIGIVQALMHRPKVLLLDEPTSALDPLIQEVVYELLREARDNGASIFFSSHVLSEVEKICDRVAILRDGRLLDVMAVEQLFEMHARRVRLRLANGDQGARELRAAGYELRSASGRFGGGSFEFPIRGDVDGLIKLLASHQIESLEIEPMSLEEIFLEYYRPSGGQGSESTG